MDLSSLNTKEAQQEGAFLHLKHPVWGYPLYTGPGADPETGQLLDPEADHEAVGVVVRGMEAQSVREAARRHEAANVARSSAAAEQAGLDFACALVVAFRGITRDGAPLEATPEAKRRFFLQSDNLVKQVTDFAKDRVNFFTAASPD